MPKPYFLARRSGSYVRFLVPLDLRDVVSSRFFIRTLRSRCIGTVASGGGDLDGLADVFRVF